jgi:hypothetical protein
VSIRLSSKKYQDILLVLGYPSIYEAGDHVPKILEHRPIGFEGLDEVLIANVRRKGMPQVDDLSILPEGKGWLVVEFGAATTEEAEERARQTMRAEPRTLGGIVPTSKQSRRSEEAPRTSR